MFLCKIGQHNLLLKTYTAMVYVKRDSLKYIFQKLSKYLLIITGILFTNTLQPKAEFRIVHERKDLSRYKLKYTTLQLYQLFCISLLIYFCSIKLM